MTQAELTQKVELMAREMAQNAARQFLLAGGQDAQLPIFLINEALVHIISMKIMLGHGFIAMGLTEAGEGPMPPAKEAAPEPSRIITDH